VIGIVKLSGRSPAAQGRRQESQEPPVTKLSCCQPKDIKTSQALDISRHGLNWLEGVVAFSGLLQSSSAAEQQRCSTHQPCPVPLDGCFADRRPFGKPFSTKDLISVQGCSKIIVTAMGLVVVLAALLAAATYAFDQVSPWPMALKKRYSWDRSGLEMNRALERFVPNNVVAKLNLQYDAGDREARLDVFFPSAVERTDQVLPVIVWVHGGSWIAGGKDYIANYLRILAARGFVTVGVDYALAPARTYPNPVRQVNAALGFLTRNAVPLHVDPSRLFLAGDSAGAQIAAQLANAISSSSYAAEVGIVPSIERSQLKGVIFHCGVYEVTLTNFARKGVLWAYFGTQDFDSDPRISQFSVARHVTPKFPPLFISAGKDDEFAPQSYSFADKVAAQGVMVDRLFFPQAYTPKVWHQFQFGLDTEAGRVALERSIAFISGQLKISE
jgi:acetyl esterase